jgi:hypothetical protein
MQEAAGQDNTLGDFEAQVKAGVTDPHPYDRLMISYRKEKKYSDELRIVNRAIAVFQKQLDTIQQNILKGNRKRAKILELSKSISRQTGLVDKKGKGLHIPEPIARWQKRKEVIERKLAGATKKKSKK